MSDEEEKMTKDECFRVLELYKNWNTCQTGWGTGKNSEDETRLLDARRALLIKATKRLDKLI